MKESADIIVTVSITLMIAGLAVLAYFTHHRPPDIEATTPALKTAAPPAPEPAAATTEEPATPEPAPVPAPIPDMVAIRQAQDAAARAAAARIAAQNQPTPKPPAWIPQWGAQQNTEATAALQPQHSTAPTVIVGQEPQPRSTINDYPLTVPRFKAYERPANITGQPTTP